MQQPAFSIVNFSIVNWKLLLFRYFSNVACSVYESLIQHDRKCSWHIGKHMHACRIRCSNLFNDLYYIGGHLGKSTQYRLHLLGISPVLIKKHHTNHDWYNVCTYMYQICIIDRIKYSIRVATGTIIKFVCTLRLCGTVMDFF